jgi:oligopeptide/dipeptide ABC transporter ATP-binding protein
MSAQQSTQPEKGPHEASALLDVRDLKLVFDTFRGTVQALEGVDLQVFPGEAVAVVGETGCGKSVTARAALGFVEPPGRVVGGEVLVEGRDVLRLGARELQKLRGKSVSLVFQEAKRALNPTATIGSQLIEAAQAAHGEGRKAAKARAIRALRDVGLADPERIMQTYAFELSGGMAQRAMIAIAMIGGARLIVADEPTSALDVSIQAQILSLLTSIRRATGSALLLITHDLGVAAENCDRIAVMYAGRVVETGGVAAVFGSPAHPYTRRLLGAIPTGDRTTLEAIPGTVPDLIDPPPGCRYANRCERASDLCTAVRPPVAALRPGHAVACHHPYREARNVDEAA